MLVDTDPGIDTICNILMSHLYETSDTTTCSYASNASRIGRGDSVLYTCAYQPSLSVADKRPPSDVVHYCELRIVPNLR